MRKLTVDKVLLDTTDIVMYEYYSLQPLELIVNFWKGRAFINFYHASICEGSLGVVILSVHLSHAWIVTKLNDALQIF